MLKAKANGNLCENRKTIFLLTASKGSLFKTTFTRQIRMKNKIFGLLKTFVAASLFLISVNLLCESSLAQKKTIHPEKKPTAFVTNRSANFETDEYYIFRLVNTERRKHHLGELEWNDNLAELARRYSEKMWRENFFSHFDRKGANVAKRAQKAKIKNWSRIGENLFSVEQISHFDAFAVNAWMESPTHRDNILDEEWTTTGVGVSEADNGDIYITQVFIKR